MRVLKHAKGASSSVTCICWRGAVRTVRRLTQAAVGRIFDAAMQHCTPLGGQKIRSVRKQLLSTLGSSVWPHLDQTYTEHKAGYAEEQGGEGIARPNFVADGADGNSHHDSSSGGDHTCSSRKATAAVESIMPCCPQELHSPAMLAWYWVRLMSCLM